MAHYFLNLTGTSNAKQSLGLSNTYNIKTPLALHLVSSNFIHTIRKIATSITTARRWGSCPTDDITLVFYSWRTVLPQHTGTTSTVACPLPSTQLKKHNPWAVTHNRLSFCWVEMGTKIKASACHCLPVSCQGVCPFLSYCWLACSWVIYRAWTFLAHGSGAWESHEQGHSVCLASAKALWLHCRMVEDIRSQDRVSMRQWVAFLLLQSSHRLPTRRLHLVLTIYQRVCPPKLSMRNNTWMDDIYSHI